MNIYKPRGIKKDLLDPERYREYFSDREFKILSMAYNRKKYREI